MTCRDDRVSYLRSHTVGITSLACVDMAPEHGDRKVMHESHGDVIDMEMSTFEIIGMPDR